MNGFRKGHSTQTAISILLNDIYNNIDNGKTIYTVFLDLQKAFDTVSHNLLLCKLSGLGLSKHSVDWFQSYLTQREQRLKLDGLMSDYEHIDYGVPQGSILGPVLFIIYINSLNQELTQSKSIMYADDIILSGTNLSALQADG